MTLNLVVSVVLKKEFISKNAFFESNELRYFSNEIISKSLKNDFEIFDFELDV